MLIAGLTLRVKGRPHYHSSKKEEYAHIRFDLDAGETDHFWHTEDLQWAEHS